ncbi:hypothetical protein N0V88_001742 [Collariella sp. IMI 366227]|nr:hypothetical protein N0V88_001742 [Collariella sp. IMI 366227]
MDDLASPSLSDYSLDNSLPGPIAPGNNNSHNLNHKPSSGSRLNGTAGGVGSMGKPRSQRRPSNRDEFDGPHQFLKRPPAEYDAVLNQVNERLAQCAFDFVAKYQFPIPLTQDMRPVERPQDREWTEWVYLLKRLATKRRIPARVLYNGQIKQFVTILENSLEMRHAAKHQSRPLKDDRNILQLISAGIQVAKILKDAQAMDYLDRLYVSTEQRIQERVAAAAAVSAGSPAALPSPQGGSAAFGSASGLGDVSFLAQGLGQDGLDFFLPPGGFVFDDQFNDDDFNDVFNPFSSTSILEEQPRVEGVSLENLQTLQSRIDVPPWQPLGLLRGTTNHNHQPVNETSPIFIIEDPTFLSRSPSHEYSPSIDSVSRGRKGPLAVDTKQSALQVRRMGACFSCHARKVRCDKERPAGRAGAGEGDAQRSELKRSVREYIQAMVDEPRYAELVTPAPQHTELPRKVLQIVHDYAERCDVPMVRRALSIYAMHFVMTRHLCLTQRNIAALQSTGLVPQGVPWVTPRVLNRQIKAVIDEMLKSLKPKLRREWAPCLASFLVLCLFMEAVETAADLFVISDNEINLRHHYAPAWKRSFVLGINGQIENMPFKQFAFQFHQIYQTHSRDAAARSFNPLVDDACFEQGELDREALLMVHKLRRFINDDWSELDYLTADPILPNTEDHPYPRNVAHNYTGRLIAKFLLSFTDERYIFDGKT